MKTTISTIEPFVISRILDVFHPVREDFKSGNVAYAKR